MPLTPLLPLSLTLNYYSHLCHRTTITITYMYYYTINISGFSTTQPLKYFVGIYIYICKTAKLLKTNCVVNMAQNQEGFKCWRKSAQRCVSLTSVKARIFVHNYSRVTHMSHERCTRFFLTFSWMVLYMHTCIALLEIQTLVEKKVF